MSRDLSDSDRSTDKEFTAFAGMSRNTVNHGLGSIIIFMLQKHIYKNNNLTIYEVIIENTM